MEQANKPKTATPSRYSIVEVLFSPCDDADTPSVPLFVEPRGNLVRKYDREELAHLTLRLSRGMASTNLKRGSKVAVIGCKLSAKIIMASFANLLNGYVTVVIPPATSAQEQIQALSSSRAEALMVDEIETALPLLQNIKALPQLRQMMVLSDTDFQKQPEILCLGWKELLERGEKQPDKLQPLRMAIQPEDEAFLYFHHDSKNRLTGQIYTHQQMVTQLHSLTENNEFIGGETKQDWQRMLSLTAFHQPHSFVASVLMPLEHDYSCMLLDASEQWKVESLAPRKTLLIADASTFDKLTENAGQQVTTEEGLALKCWDKMQEIGAELQQEDVPDASPLLSLRQWFSRIMLGKYLAPHIGGKLYAAVILGQSPEPTTENLLRGMGVPLAVLHSPTPEMLEMPGAA